MTSAFSPKVYRTDASLSSAEEVKSNSLTTQSSAGFNSSDLVAYTLAPSLSVSSTLRVNGDDTLVTVLIS